MQQAKKIKKEGLHKLPVSNDLEAVQRDPLEKRPEPLGGVVLSPEEESFLSDLIHGPKWSLEKYKERTPSDRLLVRQIITRGLNALGGQDLDRLQLQLSEVLYPETRKTIWETNHFLIIRSINKLTQKHNRFPARNEISTDSGLSRVTINKHLKEYYGSTEYAEKKEEYLAARESLLAQLYKLGINGDVKAAKAFIGATDSLTQQSITNNYIQVNGFIITQDQIKSLSEEKIIELQQIIKGGLITK